MPNGDILEQSANRSNMGPFKKTIQNSYKLLLTEFHHMTEFELWALFPELKVLFGKIYI